MKTDQVESGEWFKITRGGHKIACGDCGVVHDVYFDLHDGDLYMKMVRNNRSTGQIRRRYFKPGKSAFNAK